jgi:N-hydroxyarylamine O-acetyltransferase
MHGSAIVRIVCRADKRASKPKGVYLMSFDVSRYLDRIGLAAVPPGPAGLAALQGAQMRAIAFESIDPLLGILPDLAPDALWTKLVLNGRGGYCLELNALLGAALDALGYAAQSILGRVRLGAPVGGPRAHHAWIVTLPDGEYLVDSGFGGPGPAGPVRLGAEVEQLIAGERFRTRLDAESGETVLESLTPDGWFALYGFDRAVVTSADLAAANFFCARWDAAPFASNLLLNRLTEDGRVSLFNLGGTTVRNGTGEHWCIGSSEELAARLSDDFALAAAAPHAAAIWTRITAATALAAE